ncbi:hypothetical protein CBOM_08058 [Ceraceosorus bombacis]|uniref:Uncharacterized protein n=1 Tax=Ceraceosorus bombacis TaxID=401625 RepID=A0A0P1BKD4_9BASI|nr:hypothetical protein CBOM_08058 [Ceraceosorus bombacis]
MRTSASGAPYGDAHQATRSTQATTGGGEGKLSLRRTHNLVLPGPSRVITNAATVGTDMLATSIEDLHRAGFES